MNEEYLSSLNEAQREAVLYDDGPALVIAGAGSGKTRVITHKLIHLIHKGYAPNSLYALTFTNKAAREMKQRMLEILPYDIVGRIKMGTFHSVFSRILRQYADLLGYSSDYSIYDTSDTKALIRKIIKDLNLDENVYSPKRVLHRISICKNNLITPEAYAENPNQMQQDTLDRIPDMHRIYSIYTGRCRSNNVMDFDDILLNFNILLRDCPEASMACKNSVGYLLIDEYQDTNLSQFIIARKLVENHGKIFAVGDDAQSIYAFRGANLENVLRFDKKYPNAKLFRLEQNYRSTQNIVNVANSLIEHNEHKIPKQLFSEQEVGDKIVLQEDFLSYDEAQSIVREIQKRHLKEGVPYHDQAVLYRTNSQSRIVEDALRKMAIPYVVYGGTSFYSRKEIKNVMAYVQVILNPHNDEALERTLHYPKKGIGDKSITQIREKAHQHQVSMFRAIHLLVDEGKSAGVSKGLQAKLSQYLELIKLVGTPPSGEGVTLSEWISNIVRQTGIAADLSEDKTPDADNRLENVKELIHGAGEFEEATKEDPTREEREWQVDRQLLSLFAQNITLLTDQDTQQEEQDSVSLMTIHASKGLEFDHVHICGVEEKLLPSSLNETPMGVEEERRLLYVAITRARKTCHLHYVRIRKRNGKDEEMHPSRFLKDLDESYITVIPLLPYGGDRIGIEEPSLGSFSRGDSYYKKDDSEPATRVYSSRQSSSQMPSSYPSPSPSRASSKKLVSIPKEGGSQVEELAGLRVGMAVEHPIFGEGTIDELIQDGGNSKAVVRFSDHTKRKLLLRFAKLKPIDSNS